MNGVNVLIAEDDFRVANLHEKFLSKIPEANVVGKAATGEQTLELLQQQEVNLLLLDVYMPDQLGTDLLLTIREKFPKVDIVMITAATEKEFLEKAIRSGVQNYLIKPVSMGRFAKIIGDYIHKRELFRGRKEVDQEFIDHLLGKQSVKTTDNQEYTINLPKGIDEITLNKVIEILNLSDEGFSAEQVGESMGASRTTARRYLEYLISTKFCRAGVEYGIVGRPERKYYKR